MNHSCKVLIIFCIVTFVLLNACSHNFIPIEVLTTEYRIDSSNQPILMDSFYNFYGNDGKIVKKLNPARKNKYVNDSHYFVYDEKGRLARKYHYRYWEDDVNQVEYLADSISFIYSGDKLVQKVEYLNGRNYKPRLTEYIYQDNILVNEVERNFGNDSTLIEYPSKNRIKRTYYRKEELCNIREITILSEFDTLTQIHFPPESMQCGFNSGRLFRTVYSKNGLISFKRVKVGNQDEYSFYNSKGLLIKICQDSLQEFCSSSFEYEFDTKGNWTKRTKKTNSYIDVEFRDLKY